MSDSSAPRRMGFKHAMLQRSYDLSPSPARTSPTHNGVQNLGAGPQIQPVQVTDFSISKILGKDRKPAQDTSTSILDLSKSSSLSVRSPPAGGNVTGPGTGLSMPTPYGGYSMLCFRSFSEFWLCVTILPSTSADPQSPRLGSLVIYERFGQSQITGLRAFCFAHFYSRYWCYASRRSWPGLICNGGWI